MNYAITKLKTFKEVLVQIEYEYSSTDKNVGADEDLYIYSVLTINEKVTGQDLWPAMKIMGMEDWAYDALKLFQQEMKSRHE